MFDEGAIPHIGGNPHTDPLRPENPAAGCARCRVRRSNGRPLEEGLAVDDATHPCLRPFSPTSSPPPALAGEPPAAAQPSPPHAPHTRRRSTDASTRTSTAAATSKSRLRTRELPQSCSRSDRTADVCSSFAIGRRPSLSGRRERLGYEAAGQGFEPQLPDPESGVLPLDDPATGRRPV